MTEPQRKVWRLPPASELQSLYAVVRIELEPESDPGRYASDWVAVMCAVQAADDDAPALGVWLLGMAMLTIPEATLAAMKGIEESEKKG